MIKLSIRRLTTESDSKYRISDENRIINVTFDYATKVNKQTTRIALYSNGNPIGTVKSENIWL